MPARGFSRLDELKPETARAHAREIETAAVLDWIHGLSGTRRERLLTAIVQSDFALQRGVGELYGRDEPGARLALLLLSEWAAACGISPGELVMLMADAAGALRAGLDELVRWHENRLAKAG